ncbi:MAG: hypothetical protein ACF8LL_01935 [Phycisphaerales bacterium]
MGAQSQSQPEGWTIEGAERLLSTLTGVLNARVVAKAGGVVEEIHLLTTDEVSAKQTVRNVESALLAHFDLTVDHRKISVAQTKAPVLPLRSLPADSLDPQAVGAQYGPESKGSAAAGPAGVAGVATAPAPATAPAEGRVLFAGHEMEAERGHRIRFRVAVEWQGERYTGEATGTDLPRARLEIVAQATLRSIEAALAGPDPQPGQDPTLSLDGVKLIDAFDRHYVMVGVHAITPRKLTVLVGACPVEDSPDRATILATLQAADRWVRGRLQ